MRPIRQTAIFRWPAPLILVMAVALVLRILAAIVVQRYVDRHDIVKLCLFPDARYYWLLARTIRAGTAYEVVEWGHIAHRALRTPGYPVFLAACHWVFGESPIAVRIVQAFVGTLSVWLVYRIARQLEGSAGVVSASKSPTTAIPLMTAALAAVYPYFVALSELLLSEAPFIALMLVTLSGLLTLWRNRDERALTAQGLTPLRILCTALATGVANGAAILTRPSWALFLPAVLLTWVIAALASRDRDRARTALLCAVFIAAGTVLIMGPWWVRNARIYGRFVPTAIWFGASLYDGLNPDATGASNMKFLEEPDFKSLDEEDQDATLTRRALDFVRANPSRALELAIVKFGHYWCPWPTAEQYRSRKVAIASSIIVIPLYFCIAAGVWNSRRDFRTLVLLIGPLLYFCAVHSVFVSSIRYRVPGEFAAMPIAAIGFRSILGRVRMILTRV